MLSIVKSAFFASANLLCTFFRHFFVRQIFVAPKKVARDRSVGDDDSLKMDPGTSAGDLQVLRSNVCLR